MIMCSTIIDRQHLKTDLVHFNAKGKYFFARKLSNCLVNSEGQVSRVIIGVLRNFALDDLSAP